MKGQAFSTFKILIGAVFAMVLLSIVYNVATYKPPISSSVIIKGLVTQASNAQDVCFSRDAVDFVKGEVVTADAEAFSPTSVPCLSGRPPFSCVSCLTSSCCKSCRIDMNIKSAISAKCVPTTSTTCDVYLYFGSVNCA